MVAAIVGLMAVAWFSFSRIRENSSWETAKTANTTQAYGEFLAAWPNGRHAIEAKRKHEQARRRDDDRDWTEARKQRTIKSIEAYVEAWPNGQHFSEAKTLLEELAWEEVVASSDVDSWKKYLAASPPTRFRTKAVAALKDLEGRDLFDLIREKKIRVEVHGNGIDHVGFEVARLVAHPMKIRIASGTLCLSQVSSEQNMVVTENEERIIDRESGWFAVSAACINLEKKIPANATGFKLEQRPRSSDLAKLVRLMAAKGGSYPVKQAAIWIVTDNATTEQLQRLRIGSLGGFGGKQVISESDIQRAMELCSEAGIDVRRKAVWRERDPIERQRELDRVREMLQRYIR